MCVTFVIIVVVVGIISLALTLLDSLHMVGCGQDHFETLLMCMDLLFRAEG